MKRRSLTWCVLKQTDMAMEEGVGVKNETNVLSWKTTGGCPNREHAKLEQSRENVFLVME